MSAQYEWVLGEQWRQGLLSPCALCCRGAHKHTRSHTRVRTHTPLCTDHFKRNGSQGRRGREWRRLVDLIQLCWAPSGGSNGSSSVCSHLALLPLFALVHNDGEGQGLDEDDHGCGGDGERVHRGCCEASDGTQAAAQCTAGGMSCRPWATLCGQKRPYTHHHPCVFYMRVHELQI